MNRPTLPTDLTNNPEWTNADFARAASLRRPGRPVGATRSDRKRVTLRLPQAVIDHFRAAGDHIRLKSLAAPALRVREFSDEAVAAIQEARVDSRHDRLNALMDP